MNRLFKVFYLLVIFAPSFVSAHPAGQMDRFDSFEKDSGQSID